MPSTLIVDRASRTSSSLDGLIMAVMSFIAPLLQDSFGNAYTLTRFTQQTTSNYRAAMTAKAS
ncbi:hypothetical protein BH20PSE1_BH20PSE1_17520 [soil metagenome]